MWKLIQTLYVPLLLVLMNSGAAEDASETVIGIDLGTTYSCVGVYRYGRVEILANDQGNRITPSYVSFTPEGDRLIGEGAINDLTANPENTIFNVKRLIGRHYDEPTVQRDIKTFPFKVINRNNQPHIEVMAGGRRRSFTPEEISAMVLGKMKEIAEAYLGKKISQAVVTVPAYFNDAQRQATKDAGTIAGLRVKRIISEPTAAAIAYGLDKTDAKKNILAFDLGGGTFDVSLLTINNGVFEVMATNGDTHLGGEDFDYRVIDYFIQLCQRKHRKDIRQSNRAVQKLRREVEKAKRLLSSQFQARIQIESLYEGIDFSETLTRAKFEELNMDLFRSTLEPLEKVLEDAKISKDEVDEILLVGGSTRIPKVQQLVKDFFGGKEPSRGINPDEAVAYGAAVQGGVLGGEEDASWIMIIDINPLTLGIEVKGGVMSAVVPRNTGLPTKRSEIFFTTVDNQQSVDISVFEGERLLTEDNNRLGSFLLTGIPPLPRGVPQIEVTFEIDENSILKVTAECKSSGNINHIVIQNDNNRLSSEDIERMISEAEQFADEDRLAKQRVEARNRLELFIYGVKKQTNNDKLSETDRVTLLEAVDKQADWLERNINAEIWEIEGHQRHLEETAHPIISKLHRGGGWGLPGGDFVYRVMYGDNADDWKELLNKDEL